jgi:hypothetical protein
MLIVCVESGDNVTDVIGVYTTAHELRLVMCMCTITAAYSNRLLPHTSARLTHSI